MLIKCKECDLQVSDKAIYCPHCGYPLKPSAKPKKSTKQHLRLPNGFGQITKLKNPNLRNPYRAMVTVGKSSTGRPICKLLKPNSYFRTYNEAYAALVEYNKNPYDLEKSTTLNELYNQWSETYFNTLKSESSKRTVTSAWNYCSSIKDMRVKDIRARHIKGIMENGEYNGHKPTPGIKGRIKSLFNIMLDYALEYELVDRNYARTFSVSQDIIDEKEAAKRSHIPFTDKEIETLWKYNGIIPYVDYVLIQCYSGWRPQELGLINIIDVDLENWTFKGGIKTKAGTNRTVPIHEKIKGLVKSKYNEAILLGSDHLLNCTDSGRGLMLTYDKYAKRFENIINELRLNPEHRPHDPRVHFVTQCKKYNVDEYAIKYMVGHNISDITEKVYTQRDIDWLHKEISKIV